MTKLYKVFYLLTIINKKGLINLFHNKSTRPYIKFNAF